MFHTVIVAVRSPVRRLSAPIIASSNQIWRRFCRFRLVIGTCIGRADSTGAPRKSTPHAEPHIKVPTEFQEVDNNAENEIENDRNALVQPLFQIRADRIAHVQVLDLGGLEMGDSGAAQVANALRQTPTPHLRRLGLQQNNITCRGARDLTHALLPSRNAVNIVNTQIQVIELQDNRIGSAAMQDFSMVLMEQPNLQILNLCRNEIGNVGAVAIALGLPKTKSLESLHLDGNPIGNQGVDAIATCLEDHPHLTLLSLYLNTRVPVGRTKLSHLSAALRHHPNLQLYVQGSISSSDEMLCVQFKSGSLHFQRLLCRHCSTSPTTSVHFEYCQLDDMDMEKIDSAMRDSPTAMVLQNWWASGNSVSHLGATLLAQNILPNFGTTLQVLDLSKNPLGNDGVVRLAQDFLISNASLCELYLSHSQMGNEGVVSLVQALQRDKPNLVKLDLCGNFIGDNGVQHIARRLLRQDVGSSSATQQAMNNKKNKKNSAAPLSSSQSTLSSCPPPLQYLHLGDNPMGDEGAVEIANALHHNTLLQQLYLRPNHAVGQDGKQALHEVLLQAPHSLEDGIDIVFREDNDDE